MGLACPKFSQVWGWLAYFRTETEQGKPWSTFCLAAYHCSEEIFRASENSSLVKKSFSENSHKVRIILHFKFHNWENFPQVHDSDIMSQLEKPALRTMLRSAQKMSKKVDFGKILD